MPLPVLFVSFAASYVASRHRLHPDGPGPSRRASPMVRIDGRDPAPVFGEVQRGAAKSVQRETPDHRRRAIAAPPSWSLNCFVTVKINIID